MLSSRLVASRARACARNRPRKLNQAAPGVETPPIRAPDNAAAADSVAESICADPSVRQRPKGGALPLLLRVSPTLRQTA